MWLWIVLIVIVSLVWAIRRLLQIPSNTDRLAHHVFSSGDRLRNKVDVLGLSVIGRSLFVQSHEEVEMKKKKKKKFFFWSHFGCLKSLMKEALILVPGNVGFGSATHWQMPFGLLCRLLGTSSSFSVLGRFV